MARQRRKYTREFKLEAVKLVTEKGYSVAEATRSPQTRAEGRVSIVEYIEMFYNPKRRHSALGYLSPAEYEQAG